MTIYTLGIDVGPTVSKYIMLKDDKGIVSKFLVSVGTGAFGPQRAIEEALKNAGKTHEDMDYMLATGCGRNSLEGIADRQMSELSCHAKGAFFLSPKMHIVIDIGGQDVKVLRIESGAMVNFQMNDKCAVGMGRFLDVMTRVLEVNVEDLERLSAEPMKRVGISSTCAAFAESEVISQLVQGTNKWDIIAGIYRAIAGRVAELVYRMGLVPDVIITGGTAQNHGVVKALEGQLSCEIKTSPLTRHNGALGAALSVYQGALRHTKA